MIFADRVALFWQHHGEQTAIVILDPGRIERGAYCREKERLCCFDERRLMLHPADMWRSSIHVHNQHGRTIEATNDDRIGNHAGACVSRAGAGSCGEAMLRISLSGPPRPKRFVNRALQMRPKSTLAVLHR
ncbi:hypothetical protein CK218_28250 [Mesorhizobium sp. WSM3879]|nr:hypothetical protein CK214_27830 [Mesorhizobium sp. WSM3882]PBB31161.1 hypothetical protein CK221_27835 [Mesorhizobium sp. WSM3868]PBB77823.1 hypothetical protein CK218_28250 [Mesorhizobium sp. WSM3879]